MHAIEKTVIAIRHSKYLERAEAFWSLLRPLYDRVVARAGRDGLERNINGTDRLVISTRCRGVSEQYEPEVWRKIMAEVRTGDVIADVGAFIGLYTIALARRVGSAGRVFSFEPAKSSFEILREHVDLNHLAERVELVQAAVGSTDGFVNFKSNGSESRVVSDSGVNGSCKVDCATLDKLFANRRLDVMKVDVEGYEEIVLRGAVELFADVRRKPRAIFIEVHPFIWPDIATTSESLLQLLRSSGYKVLDLNGDCVERIEEYGEIIAVNSLVDQRKDRLE